MIGVEFVNAVQITYNCVDHNELVSVCITLSQPGICYVGMIYIYFFSLSKLSS